MSAMSVSGFSERAQIEPLQKESSVLYLTSMKTGCDILSSTSSYAMQHTMWNRVRHKTSHIAACTTLLRAQNVYRASLCKKAEETEQPSWDLIHKREVATWREEILSDFLQSQVEELSMYVESPVTSKTLSEFLANVSDGEVHNSMEEIHSLVISMTTII